MQYSFTSPAQNFGCQSSRQRTAAPFGMAHAPMGMRQAVIRLCSSVYAPYRATARLSNIHLAHAARSRPLMTVVRRQHALTSCSDSQLDSKPLYILGIESSCDDTAAAVVTSDGSVLGEAIATQAEIHAPFGGVVPSLAQDAHRSAITRVVGSALASASISAANLDAIAVTVGPGLSLCLDVGVRKAHDISREHNLPIISVHHMEAHALVARMTAGGPEALPFPFLCLLVSGGHNLLVLVKGVGNYTQLGTTLDDALGEAYDKVARMLGLDLNPNGGAALEAVAKHGDPDKYPFAVPMKKHQNCDFSYAGLKTSVRLCIERLLGSAEGAGKRAITELHGSRGSSSSSSGGPDHSSSSSSSETDHSSSSGAEASSSSNQEHQIKADIAASFQKVAVQHLVMRLQRAITWSREECPSVGHLVVAGGVASNKYLRQEVAEVAASAGLQLVVPPPKWCTDNGVMVAWAGVERFQLGLVEPPAGPLPTDGSPEWIELRPRWPLTSHKHAKSISPQAVRSMKSANKFAVSLTDMTHAELQRRQRQQHEDELSKAKQTETAAVVAQQQTQAVVM